MKHPDFLTSSRLKAFIRQAIREDVGDGDHSSLASIPQKATNEAVIRAKGEGFAAGIEAAEKIFHFVDPSLEVVSMVKDGEFFSPGDILLEVSGSARSILTAERTVLNCMQRMSGIATYTRKLSEIIKGSGAKILDTRKTTPNFRLMEKWAVWIGGGQNHRFGLYDMIMLKDNHIDFAGGITEAIEATRRYLKKENKDLRIEVETRNLEEVREVITTGGVDVIMLDNMMPSEMKEAIKLIDGRYETEASGGINEETIREVAECGVDYISLGAITHSASIIDMSLVAKA